MEHKPIHLQALPAPAPTFIAPMPAPAPVVSPHVNVYDVQQTNVYDLHPMMISAPAPVPIHHHHPKPVFVRNDAGMILVLFILLVIIARSRFAFGKC